MRTAVGINTSPNSPSRVCAGSHPADSPPSMAPTQVAISSVMPNCMFAVCRSTFALATALEVAMTVTMLVATA